MKTERYLLGSYAERQRIDRLMFRNLPGRTSYDFSYICDEFTHLLIEEEACAVHEASQLITYYMEDFEVDVCETDSLHRVDFTKYLADVREALGYFCSYLDLLDFYPVPKTLKVLTGTPTSVLLFEIFDPRKPRPTFSTQRNL